MYNGNTWNNGRISDICLFIPTIARPNTILTEYFTNWAVQKVRTLGSRWREYLKKRTKVYKVGGGHKLAIF